MPRPPRKKDDSKSPVDAKQREVREREVKLRADLERTQKFLEEAPRRKAEAERKRREELLTRAARVGRIDGPMDHRLNSVTAIPTRAPRLRKERNHGQLMFIFLLILLCVVIAWNCRLLLGH